MRSSSTQLKLRLLIHFRIPLLQNFQSNSLVEPCLEDEGVGGDASELTHVLDKGLPQNPGFPLKEAFGNVANCFPCGIGLVR